MKTTFQNKADFLKDNDDFILYNKIRREELINSPSIPADAAFSDRLNLWLEKWYEQHKHIFVFTDTDDFEYNDIKGNLIRYTERFKTTGKIHIWRGSSNDTIFGSSPKVNLYYRAHHDHTHITYGCGFTLAGEAKTAAIQASMLPSDWFLEKELIYIDLVGMNLYYNIHKEFVKEQRKFVLSYMKSPSLALFTKQ